MLRNRIACDDDKAHPFQTVTSPYCQLSLQISQCCGICRASSNIFASNKLSPNLPWP